MTNCSFCDEEPLNETERIVYSIVIAGLTAATLMVAVVASGRV